MNFVSKPFLHEMQILATGERYYELFISRRLVRFIKKQCKKGLWRFSYVNIKEVNFHGYEPVLMGFSGIVIFQKG